MLVVVADVVVEVGIGEYSCFNGLAALGDLIWIFMMSSMICCCWKCCCCWMKSKRAWSCNWWEWLGMANAGTFIGTTGGATSDMGCNGGGCWDDGFTGDGIDGITNGGGPVRFRGGGEFIGDLISA